MDCDRKGSKTIILFLKGEENRMKEKVILFQGDSITDGNRLKGKENEWDLNHQIGHCYAYIISGQLGVQYPDKNLRFYDRGISGNKIADLSERWTEDTLDLKPDVLSILIGVNDCGGIIKDGSGSTSSEFRVQYQDLIDRARKMNPDIVLVLCEPFGLPVGVVKDNWERWMDLLSRLQEVTKMVAEENNAIFVPLQKKFESLCKIREAEYWIWDGIHPTVCGHQVIAEQWLKYVNVIDVV